MTPKKRLFSGACHCGAVKIGFETARPVDELTVRACQCGFCRRHGALTVSDPAGSMWIKGDGAEPLSYRFGLGITDCLICPRCGCYMGAVMAEGDEAFGILNARMLDDADAFTVSPAPRDYDGEDDAARRQRRRKAWTPMTRA